VTTAKGASAVLGSAGVKSVSKLQLRHAKYEIVRVPEGQDYMATLRALEGDPRVKAVGPNVIKRVSAIRQASDFLSNDPRLLNGAAGIAEALQIPAVRDSQWGLLITGAQTAWETTTGSPEVVVAVIDTGVNFQQEDMQGRWWFNKDEIPNNGSDDDGNGYVDDYRGYDFYTFAQDGGDPDATDPSGDSLSHGMATSSIIAARINNGTGIAGVAGGTGSGGVRIMPLRVGTDSDIPVSAEIAAIDYAIEMGADIISMSFGGATGGPPEEQAINRAWDAGVLTFAASGNYPAGNPDGVDLPAGFEKCIAVGATTIFDRRDVNASTNVTAEELSDYSKTGPEMDIAAPGNHIAAAMNAVAQYTMSNGQEFTGTSAATPLVAGFAALILSANPGWTNQQIWDRMRTTALDLGPAGWDESFGWGRIDMARALPPQVVIAEGDYNKDGAVNEADMDEVRSRYGLQSGQASYSADVDGNGDGVIDELDIFLIGRNYSG
jgi:hypothetical protein